jgi:DNA polymerase III delta subunit
MVYLFIGEDTFSKALKLKAIKSEFLKAETAQFNFDILYAKELTLKDLQEKLIYLPVKSPKRILVIKEAQALKEESKEFIIKYTEAPYKQLILILDIDRQDNKDEFVNRLYKHARIIRFRETKPPDTFTLSRQIELRKPDYALRLLNQLLKDGERPERILGGLRYSFERNTPGSLELKRRLRLLLNCDIAIKTGKLKAVFALERLVIQLCSQSPPRKLN